MVSDTTCHVSISLDGYVAGPDQSREEGLGRRLEERAPTYAPYYGIYQPREPARPVGPPVPR